MIKPNRPLFLLGERILEAVHSQIIRFLENTFYFSSVTHYNTGVFMNFRTVHQENTL